MAAAAAACLPVVAVMGVLLVLVRAMAGGCWVGGQVRSGCCGARGARTYFDTSRPGGYCGGAGECSVSVEGAGTVATVGDSAGTAGVG